MLDLAHLRRVAEAAGPDGWAVSPDHREGMEWNNHIVLDRNSNLRVAFMAHDPADQNVRLEAAAHLIAAMDPPTVLALLDRLEAAERVVEAAMELTSACIAMDELQVSGQIVAAWDTSTVRIVDAKRVLYAAVAALPKEGE